MAATVQFFEFIDDAPQRLDNFLFSRLKGVPKSHIYKMIRQGEIRVNKKRHAQHEVLQKGDIIRVAPLRMAATELHHQNVNYPPTHLPILFEDQDLLIINKPAGMAVHGGSGVSYGVIEYLRHIRNHPPFLELAHRLDKETSGILILAKKRSALLALQQQIQQQICKKRYTALVWGHWSGRDWQKLDAPLRKYVQADQTRVVRVHEDGQASMTLIKVVQHALAVDMPVSLLDIQLKTGRTHQIRVHVMHAGHPILGDEKYGNFSQNKTLEKLQQKNANWYQQSPHILSGSGNVVGATSAVYKQYISEAVTTHIFNGDEYKLDVQVANASQQPTLYYQKARMFLHAYAISFVHPRTQENVHIRTHQALEDVFKI